MQHHNNNIKTQKWISPYRYVGIEKPLNTQPFSCVPGRHNTELSRDNSSLPHEIAVLIPLEFSLSFFIQQNLDVSFSLSKLSLWHLLREISQTFWLHVYMCWHVYSAIRDYQRKKLAVDVSCNKTACHADVKYHNSSTPSYLFICLFLCMFFFGFPYLFWVCRWAVPFQGIWGL